LICITIWTSIYFLKPRQLILVRFRSNIFCIKALYFENVHRKFTCGHATHLFILVSYISTSNIICLLSVYIFFFFLFWYHHTPSKNSIFLQKCYQPFHFFSSAFPRLAIAREYKGLRKSDRDKTKTELNPICHNVHTFFLY
jgi:hypothetical protein